MTMTIRVPDELHRNLKETAERRGQTLNGYVVQLLWQGRETNGRTGDEPQDCGNIHSAK